MDKIAKGPTFWDYIPFIGALTAEKHDSDELYNRVKPKENHPPADRTSDEVLFKTVSNPSPKSEDRGVMGTVGALGGGWLAYEIAKSLIPEKRSKKDNSIWQKVLAEILPMTAAGLGAYGGWKLSKTAEDSMELTPEARSGWGSEADDATAWGIADAIQGTSYALGGGIPTVMIGKNWWNNHKKLVDFNRSERARQIDPHKFSKTDKLDAPKYYYKDVRDPMTFSQRRNAAQAASRGSRWYDPRGWTRWLKGFFSNNNPVRGQELKTRKAWHVAGLVPSIAAALYGGSKLMDARELFERAKRYRKISERGRVDSAGNITTEEDRDRTYPQGQK